MTRPLGLLSPKRLFVLTLIRGIRGPSDPGRREVNSRRISRAHTNRMATTIFWTQGLSMTLGVWNLLGKNQSLSLKS